MEKKQPEPFAEKKHSSAKKCGLLCLVPFVVGIVLALIVGWVIFPKLMYKTEAQPVDFSHTKHVIGASLTCSTCHYVQDNGEFSGIPTTEDCAVCHSRPMSGSPKEMAYIDEYVKPQKETKWKVYQKQPDNVFFSHAAHSLATCNTCHTFTEAELCSQCHIPVYKMNGTPELEENRLTEYRPTTMKMWECEQCHANPNHYEITNASNACFVCHK